MTKFLFQKLIRLIPSTKLRSLVCKLYANEYQSDGKKIAGDINGFIADFDLKESIQRQIFIGAYELEQTRWVSQCLHDGDVFVDVGASFGHYTTFASRLVGMSGKVYSFEPSPVAFERLSQTVEKSSVKNININRMALGDNEGESVLYLPSTDYVHSPSFFKSDPTFTPIKISVTTLDKFCMERNITKIKLVKIDVEGCEPNVLFGMDALIKMKCVENVICELNSGWLMKNKFTNNSLIDLFESYGFYIYRKNKMHRNLPAHEGGTYDLQDVWFKLSQY